MSAPIRLPPLRRERLDNGLEVVVATRPGVPLVAARIVLRGGASLDPPERFGLSHLVALAARRGTVRRSGEEIDLLVESLGADLGTGVDEDASYLGLSAPLEALARCLEVLAEVAISPTFPAAEVARLRRREVASLAHDLDEPAVVADRAMLEAAYGSHPYGHPPEGRARHLLRLRRAEVLGFHGQHYRPEAAILLVVGPVSADEVLAAVRRRFGRWERGGAARLELRAPEAPHPAVVVVDKPDLTQTQIRIVSAGFPRRSPDYYPGMVASAVLGGGFTSRLMEAIRVNRGLSYGVRSRFATSLVGGLFYVSSFTKQETTAELVEVALGEMARFADGGPSPEELSRMQNYLCGLFPLSLETHDQVAERLADLAFYGLDETEVTGFRERVRAVDREDCRRIAQRYFPGPRPLVVVVGPARHIAGPLERFGPVRVLPARKVT
ncbi:MAG TPA: pitrilysin family protein [Anaeromyxobacter sp.]|nr:pitrilysin family protein [Anaeromyxobacter sp.]